MTVTVIGVDGDQLGPGDAEVLASARLVVGNKRHLLAHAPETARQLELEPRSKALSVLSSLAGAEQGVVLVPGDPCLFGLLGELRQRGIHFTVRSAASAVQRLLARLGRPWDDVAVAGVTAESLRQVINLCRARRATVVVTGPDAGPAQLGSGLAGWRRTMIVGEAMGTEDETVTTLDPEEAARRTWRPDSVVLCVSETEGPADAGWLLGGVGCPPESGWALSGEEFSHRDGMLTEAEVRAVALAKLAPRPGALIWDVGAGSGSVAVECARMGAATIAVESDEAQAVRMVTNAAGHGVDIRIVEGTAPGVLRDLPTPDAVFVGGGGADVVTSCAHVGARRVVVALAALDRVGSTRDALRNAGYEVDGVQLSANRLVELSDGETSLRPTDPVVVVSGVRKSAGRFA